MASVLAAHPDKFTLEEVVGGWKIAVSALPILAGTLPYTVIAKAATTAVLSETMRVAAQIELYTAGPYGVEGSLLFSKPISLARLGYGSLKLSHGPATAADAAAWDSYTNSGAQDFPAYLVAVRSRLALDGATVAEGAPLGIGQDLILKVSLGIPGQTRTALFRILSGDAMEIGIDGAGQSALAGLRRAPDSAWGQVLDSAWGQVLQSCNHATCLVLMVDCKT